MLSDDDQYNLERFVAAQDAGETFRQAIAELRQGRKTGHWMWFVFPQIAGLGHSPTSQLYPVLGPRLAECAEIICGVEGRSAEQIFGGIDAQKLRSSATLFALADPATQVFQRLLDRYFDGVPDPATEARI
jgi:uncharacterized protein (DUF1810 family)